MATIRESSIIRDVKFAHLQEFADTRGRFVETFRREWFPERTWEQVQGNRSDSKAGVLRGLHYHLRQIDYWYAVAGTIRVVLLDVRPNSPSCGKHEILEIGDANPVGVFVPVGVAHGFLALTDATLTYLVDQYYDNTDERGVAWDDPDLGIDWGIADPILSPRDQENPRLRDIPRDELP